MTQISSALVQGNAAGTAVNTAASSAASNAGSGNAGAGVAGGAAGGTQPLLLPDAVLTSGGRLSLAVEDAKPSEPVKSSIQIFSSRSGETVAKGNGQYSFVDQGSTVSLALEGGATRSAPQVQASGAQTAEGAVPLGTGGVMTLRVSLQSDETLAVEVPSAGSTLGSEAITAYALTVAKKRFGLPPQGVKAVVVQYL